MRLAFTVLFIFLRIFAGAQPSTPGILWQHNYGGTKDDELRSMELTDDGGFICAGYAKSSDGDIDSIQGASDFWVMKCDSAGTIQWQRTYGGTSNDWARSISITSDGGYIVAGYSKSNDGDVSGNHGDFDYWVLRLTSTGDIMWQKSYGGSKKDNAYRAIETYDGNFIVAGFTSSTDGDVSGNHGRQDYWVLKLDANGNIIWKKALGGAQNDQASMVIETSDHDYVIIGFAHSSDGNVNDNKGAEDIWVVKLSKGGKMRWKKSYGGSKNDAGRWIEQTPDGAFFSRAIAHPTI